MLLRRYVDGLKFLSLLLRDLPFTPEVINMCMRLQEVIANPLAPNCGTNSPSQYCGKCIENMKENMYFDVRALRFKCMNY